MPISDYDKTKSLVVQSVSGTPTVDKAQPIYLTSGDDSQTGTGEIVLDWSGISGPEDIAVYDQNDNLLDYEIEELDTTNETGVIWVYNSWTRDGTVQAKVAYGNGPGDNQNVSGTWESSSAGPTPLAVQHLHDDPLTATDSTTNNYDGTISGSVSASGQFSRSASFYGTDDKIELGTPPSKNNYMISLWFKGSATDKQGLCFLGETSTDSGIGLQVGNISGGDARVQLWGNDLNLTAEWNTGEWYQFVGVWYSNGGLAGYFDGSLINSIAPNADITLGTNYFDIGQESGTAYFSGEIDEFKLYEPESTLTAADYEDFVKAEYDASAKAGQTFFSQEAASGGGGSSAPTGVVETNNGERQTGSDGVVSAG